MTTDATIRLARPDDDLAIHEVHRTSFPTEDEARLADRLRTDGDALVSVVAALGGAIVGHVLFSRMGIVGSTGEIPAVALAPVAVRPDWRCRGFAAAAIEEGLRLCAARGERIVLVLGDPAYYRRFGFAAEAAAAIEGPWPGPHFMALALVPGALDGIAGRVCYPSAFGLPD